MSPLPLTIPPNHDEGPPPPPPVWDFTEKPKGTRQITSPPLQLELEICGLRCDYGKGATLWLELDDGWRVAEVPPTHFCENQSRIAVEFNLSWRSPSRIHLQPKNSQYAVPVTMLDETSGEFAAE